MIKVDLDGSGCSILELREPAMIIARNEDNVVLLKVGELTDLRIAKEIFSCIETELGYKVLVSKVYDTQEFQEMLRDRSKFRQLMLTRSITDD